MKTLRLEYLKENMELKCDKAFIPLGNILINYENLSHMVGVFKSSEQNRNLSKKDINASAEMFMYLNSCPSFYVKLYWKTIYGPKLRMAMLATNIAKKAKKDFKLKATQIFAKISEVLGFKHISYHYKGNESFECQMILHVIRISIQENYM